MHKGLALLGALLFLAAAAAAQDSPGAAASPPSGLFSSLSPTPIAPVPAPPSPSSERMHNYNFQLALGFSVVRFNKDVFGNSHWLRGINTEGAYFFSDWVGVEGEFIGTFGHTNVSGAKFAFVGGGVKIADRGKKLEPWGHVLVGFVEFQPQTVFSTHAFGFEMGGGVDFRFKPQISFRGQGDYIRSSLYNTSQNNIKLAGGIVINF